MIRDIDVAHPLPVHRVDPAPSPCRLVPSAQRVGYDLPLPEAPILPVVPKLGGDLPSRAGVDAPREGREPPLPIVARLEDIAYNLIRLEQEIQIGGKLINRPPRRRRHRLRIVRTRARQRRRLRLRLRLRCRAYLALPRQCCIRLHVPSPLRRRAAILPAPCHEACDPPRVGVLPERTPLAPADAVMVAPPVREPIPPILDGAPRRVQRHPHSQPALVLNRPAAV